MFYFYFNLLYINVDLDPLPQFLYIPPTTSVFYLSLSLNYFLSPNHLILPHLLSPVTLFFLLEMILVHINASI